MEKGLLIHRRFRTGGVQIQARAEGETALIRGTGIVFGELSQDLGGFIERVEPGAFDEADMADVRGLFNHDSNLILGRTAAGTMKLTRTERGIEYEIDPPATQLSDDLRKSISRGDVNGSSFSFSLGRGGWEIEERDDGTLVYHVVKVERVYDMGPVTFPAYTQTESYARGLEPARVDIESHRTQAARNRAAAAVSFDEQYARLRGI